MPAEHLSYVIYTSGSTGKPKGVEVTHQNLSNLISWHQRAFAVTAKDRATHLASVGFDASIWEVWPYLTAGASVHLPHESLRYQPAALRNWLVEQQITISFVPTLIAERLLSLDWPATTRLRALLTGADVLHRYPSRQLPFTVFNNYGPTECTVVATSSLVSSLKRPDPLPPIGRPIDNAQVYILDEHLQEVAAGSVGELYIGGAGVARGYHNNPELTAQKFIADPFSVARQARLYRTGDLGRRLSDGQIAFVGRTDDQVKIRGFRIEPNEIVVAINQHAMVDMSYLLARERSSGEKQLVAYVVESAGEHLSEEEIRSWLAARLPEYMIPDVFMFVPSLPLNASGKVDHSALPPPEERATPDAKADTTPRAIIKERMADILRTLLGVAEIDGNNNFFLAGGNSLLGTQLISRIRDTFGVEMPLLDLFDHPTVSELSAETEKLIVKKLEASDGGGAA